MRPQSPAEFTLAQGRGWTQNGQPLRTRIRLRWAREKCAAVGHDFYVWQPGDIAIGSPADGWVCREFCLRCLSWIPRSDPRIDAVLDALDEIAWNR